MYTIRIISSSGDTIMEYDPDTQTDLATARLKTLREQGYILATLDPETKETTLVNDLFKLAPQIVAIPQISGG